MEAVLLTAALVLLIVGALMALGRSWPGSSRRTGYRIRDHDDPVRPIREDDEPPAWHIPPVDASHGAPDGEPRAPGRGD